MFSFLIAELPSTKFGEKLREQVEERLTFFETGDTPRKNMDVMKEALTELEAERTTDIADKLVLTIEFLCL